MPDVRGILRRFRPAGAPGAAAPRAVPADRPAERDAELAPVFALLEDVERDCSDLVGAARSAAAERRAQADLQVQAILAEGRRRAESERAGAAADVRRQAEEEAEAVLAAAREQARRTTDTAQRRLPELVAEAHRWLSVALAGDAGAESR